MFKFDLGFDVDIRYALPPVAARVTDHKSGFSVNLPVLGFALTGALLMFVSLWFLCCYCVKIEQARLRLYGMIGRMEVGDIVIINGEQVEPMVEEGQVDHPIWYIRTQGLQQSVIDSISVVKYKKDEGLVEGSDCSICLSEFEEDESLRLLPKCSHAFHVPCIDQWFRSHKNCPMCRSPVTQVIVAGTPMFSADEVREAVRMRQENQEELEGQQSDEMGVGDMNTSEEDSVSSLPENGWNATVSNGDSAFSHNKTKSESNLPDNRIVADNELQPMRRTASAGPATTSKIYEPVAEIKVQVESDSSLDSNSSPVQMMKATASSSSSKSNSPQNELIKTKGAFMKRSISFGGKPSFAKSGKGQNTILPY